MRRSSERETKDNQQLFNQVNIFKIASKRPGTPPCVPRRRPSATRSGLVRSNTNFSLGLRIDDETIRIALSQSLSAMNIRAPPVQSKQRGRAVSRFGHHSLSVSYPNRNFGWYRNYIQTIAEFRGSGDRSCPNI